MKALLSIQTSIKVSDAEISDLAAKLMAESNDDRGIDYKHFIERFTKQHICLKYGKLPAYSICIPLFFVQIRLKL